MSEHLTRNTEYDESLRWCTACQQYTMQRRKPGSERSECQRPEHIERHAQRMKQIAEEQRITKLQPRLFP